MARDRCIVTLTEVLRCQGSSPCISRQLSLLPHAGSFSSLSDKGRGFSITAAGHEGLYPDLSRQPVPNSQEGDFTAAR